MHRALVMAIVVASLAGARPARADGFTLERYEPTPAGSWFMAVPQPWYSSTRLLAAGLTLDYGHNPLLGGLFDPRFHQTVAIVEHQLVGHLDVAGSLPRSRAAVAVAAGGAARARHGGLRRGPPRRRGRRRRAVRRDGAPVRAARAQPHLAARRRLSVDSRRRRGSARRRSDRARPTRAGGDRHALRAAALDGRSRRAHPRAADARLRPGVGGRQASSASASASPGPIGRGACTSAPS